MSLTAPSLDAAPPGGAEGVADALAQRLQATRDALNDGHFQHGESLALHLYDDAQTAGHPLRAAEAALLLARLKANLFLAQAAVAWAERAIEQAVAAGSRALQASAWVVLAGAAADLDRPVVALNAISRAMSLVDDDMPGRLRRSVFTGIAITYNALGMPRQALPASRRAFEAEDAAGIPRDRLRERWNLLTTGLRAHEQLLTVDPAAAAALLRELEPHADALQLEAAADGQPVYRAGADDMTGQLRLAQGRAEEAVASMQACLAHALEESPEVLRMRWVTLARAQQAAGRPAEALASAERARALGAQCEAAIGFQDLLELSTLHALLGEHAQALALHRRYHAQVVHNLLAAQEVRVAELSAQLSQQALRLENLDLRERYQGLADHAEQLSRLARTDTLTGALTRRALETAFDALAATGAPLALMLVDVDHFKQVNDRHSHLMGDEVLRRIAQLLAEQLRGDDRVGRYGGEEFLVLLAGAPALLALRVAERLRERVQAHDWPALAPGLAVTFSAGLVQLRPGEGFEQAVARADLLLYRAKDQGRNRVLSDSR